ncbi:MAG: response regulator, partial [Methanosarcinaceae archaeon]|nr:response regulator [Methanosarcinaceae archaeon]
MAIQILWVDDEIDMLRPHIMFLEEKGYDVYTSNNGEEGLELLSSRSFDIVFLDEQMPGLSGIETLTLMKNRYPSMPIIMITKSEEEAIMEDAIGSKISDYLIKPVNPKQILLCLKKNLDTKKLVSEKTTMAYQQEFRNIGMEISPDLTHDQWKDVYKKIIYWELELNRSQDDNIADVLRSQKEEANQVFSRFIETNYLEWISAKSANRPTMSHTLVKDKIFPLLNGSRPSFLILIDNLRY